MRKFTFLFLLITPIHLLQAQSPDTLNQPQSQFSLLTSVGYSRSFFVETGLALNSFRLTGSHLFGANFYLSNEVYFRNNIIVAPKVGAWISGGSSGIILGVSLLFYSDFHDGAFVFRPEIGIGNGAMKMAYGYNDKFTNTIFENVSKNVFQLTYCFKLVRLKKRNGG